VQGLQLGLSDDWHLYLYGRSDGRSDRDEKATHPSWGLGLAELGKKQFEEFDSLDSLIN